MKLWAEIGNRQRAGKWHRLHPYHNVPTEAPGCPAAVRTDGFVGTDSPLYGHVLSPELYLPCDNPTNEPGRFCFQHDPSSEGRRRRREMLNQARQERVLRWRQRVTLTSSTL